MNFTVDASACFQKGAGNLLEHLDKKKKQGERIRVPNSLNKSMKELRCEDFNPKADRRLPPFSLCFKIFVY